MAEEHITVTRASGVQRTLEVSSRKLYHETIVVSVNEAKRFDRTSELRSVIIQASASNAGIVMVGNSKDVSSAAGTDEGFNLSKGEHLTMTITNASQVWVVGTNADDRAILLGLS